jgi:hypothetical protein
MATVSGIGRSSRGHASALQDGRSKWETITRAPGTSSIRRTL